nr:hypothetical protein Iba_chr10aCG7610 [Ipomoea batatas]
MTGFIRIVSVQRYVSVKMVIADYGGAPPPPYGSYPSNFPNGFGSYPSNFSNGFTSFPFSNGFTSVPVSRPQFYTQTWQEEYSEEEVDLAVQVNGDSGNNALHKCYKFLADWFHKFYGNFKGFVYDFKHFLADWFDQFFDNFVIFLNDFKHFLYNLEHYIDRSTVFIEHCTEFINSLNRIMEEWNDMKVIVANNGTQETGGDSYHCHCYNNNNCECYRCIGFRRGGPSNGGKHRGVRRKEVQKLCKLCNPPRAEAANDMKANPQHMNCNEDEREHVKRLIPNGMEAAETQFFSQKHLLESDRGSRYFHGLMD